jgi:hypothetical protein
MSLVDIVRGLKGKLRLGKLVRLLIDGEEIRRVTLEEGKYLTIQATEYILVTAGSTVRLEIEDNPPQEYTVPQGRVMVVHYKYEDVD